MSTTYLCQQCGVRITLETPLPELACPKCKQAMQEEGAAENVRVVGVPRPLKVARPTPVTGNVAPSGGPSPVGTATVAVPPPGRHNPNANLPGETTQAGSYHTPMGGGFAQEMERMVETARRQAEKEMELTLEAAHLRAEKESQQIISKAEKEAQQLVDNANRSVQEQMAEVKLLLARQREDAEAALAKEIEERRTTAQAKLDQQLAETKKSIAEKLEKEIRQKREEGLQQVEKELVGKREEGQKLLLEKARKMAEETRQKVKELLSDAEKEAKEKRAEGEKLLLESRQKKESQLRELSEEKKKFEDQMVAAKKALQEKATSLYEEIKKKAEEEASKVVEKAQSEADEIKKQSEKLQADLSDREKESSIRLQNAEKREAEVKSLFEEARKSGLQVVTVKDDKALAQMQLEVEKLRRELVDCEAKSKIEMEQCRKEADRSAQEKQAALERRMVEKRKAEIDASAGAQKLQMIQLHGGVLIWFYTLLMGLRCSGWQALLSWCMLALVSVGLFILLYSLRKSLALLVKKAPPPNPLPVATPANGGASTIVPPGNGLKLPSPGLTSSAPGKTVLGKKTSQGNAFPGLKKNLSAKPEEKKPEEKKAEEKKAEEKKVEEKKAEEKKDF